MKLFCVVSVTRNVTAICLVLALSQVPSNWGQLKYTSSGRMGEHSCRVEIECANFEPRGRKLAWVQDGKTFLPTISGRAVWGFEGWREEDARQILVRDFLGKKAIEIRKFQVAVDGKDWPVASYLTDDILNPNLDRAADRENVVVGLARDGTSLTLSMCGSDGRGAYQVAFTFNKNGRIVRKISMNGVVKQTRKA